MALAVPAASPPWTAGAGTETVMLPFDSSTSSSSVVTVSVLAVSPMAKLSVFAPNTDDELKLPLWATVAVRDTATE